MSNVLDKISDLIEPTPMMRQYIDVKRDYEGIILMYRLGDFYEMFFEDAVLASRELELTLTARDCGNGLRAAMCGVPFHKADDYIGRLVDKGYKVAVCEQVENPSTAVGLVKREIVRVVTPGTVTDANQLSESKNNFLASLYYDKIGVGIAFADISTGLLSATYIDSDNTLGRIKTELGIYTPSELLVSVSRKSIPEVCAFIKERFPCTITDDRMKFFSYDSGMFEIEKTFGAATAEKTDNHAIACAVGGLLGYIKDTQKSEKSLMRELNIYVDGEYMELDINTCRNLELVETMRNKEKRGSLLWVLDKTKTAMGARMLRSWLLKPSININTIEQRQEATECLLKDYMLREELREMLSTVRDVERIMAKVVYATANAKDLKTLCDSFSQLPDIKALLLKSKGRRISEIAAEFDTLDDIYELLLSSICENPPFTVREGGMIRDGYNEEIDRLRSIRDNSKEWLKKLEDKEKELTGIKNLRFGYNKIFGYFIEVTNSQKSLVPQDRYIRKQTLTNCERYITEELKNLESEVLFATDRLTALEYEIFTFVREAVAAKSSRIQATASMIAELDIYLSFAEVASKNGYIRPELLPGNEIDVKDSRHPVVEKFVDGAYFVPNDIYLDTGKNRLMLITGPNMAGKSTYMRQTALICIMAQIGSFVPASNAKIGIVDKVFTRVGASDDLASGQSTFMLEMNEVSYILKHATPRSLIVYDEVGRGTSTFDGMSIARAVAEYTAMKIKAKTLFATHYHELTSLENEIDGVVNYNIAAKKKNDSIVFLRKIVKGATDDSYGIEVAKLAGVPSEVIKRAKEILSDIEESGIISAPPVKNAKKEESFGFDLFTSIEDDKNREAAEKIRSTDINTLTPIEAMNLIFELKQLLK